VERQDDYTPVVQNRAGKNNDEKAQGNCVVLLDFLGIRSVRCLGCSEGIPLPQPTPSSFFESKVRPVLVARCDECHGESAEGGLRLDSREGLMKGGESGAVLVPGNPDASLLIQAVRQTHKKLRMPKRHGKLAADEIESLEKWVAAGAVWPESSKASPPAKRIDVASQLDFFGRSVPLTNPAGSHRSRYEMAEV